MFGKLCDTPWKVWNELRRWLVLPYVRLLFLVNGVKWGKGWRIYGVPIIQRHRRSEILIGDGLQLHSSVRSNPLSPYHPVALSTRCHGSRLLIGDQVGITGGTICAAEYIKIGSRVVIGANSIIVDTDFHPLSPEERMRHGNVGKSAPVIIEDDVFIGMNCLILKGVTIGRGSVVGAGSVVTRNVPPGVVVAGNPARVVQEQVTRSD